MLARAQAGARGYRTRWLCSLGFRRCGGGRLQFLVDAFVHKIGAFIEILVWIALFGPHPAFAGGARVRHWLWINGGLDRFYGLSFRCFGFLCLRFGEAEEAASALGALAAAGPVLSVSQAASVSAAVAARTICSVRRIIRL